MKNTRRAQLVVAVIVVLIGLAVSVEAAVPAAPSPTLWEFLGIPQGLHKMRDTTSNRRGNRPNAERTDPVKSAGAAARLLRNLHARFGDWPLALAAYNAGAGRVEHLLTAKKAKTFGEISPSLSVETRFYVPKVCATIALRTGLRLEQFIGRE